MVSARAIGRAKVDASGSLRGALSARVRKVGGDVPTVRAGVGPRSAAPPRALGAKVLLATNRDDDESGSSDDSDDSDDDDDERRAMFDDEESALVNAAANVVDSLNDDASNEPKWYVVFRSDSWLLLPVQEHPRVRLPGERGAGGFRAPATTVGAQVECFASPLNAFHGRYHSAFPDVDGPFGSSLTFPILCG